MEELNAIKDKPAPFTNDAKRRKDIEAALRGDDGEPADKKKKKKGKWINSHKADRAEST